MVFACATWGGGVHTPVCTVVVCVGVQQRQLLLRPVVQSKAVGHMYPRSDCHNCFADGYSMCWCSRVQRRAVGLGVSDHKLQEKLRIVSGSAAGRKLVSFRSPQTRPMMEKVRRFPEG
jgi:hypothetical protein